MRNRVDVLHGVNLDQLGPPRPRASTARSPSPSWRSRCARFAQRARTSRLTFWQTNHEGEYCESLHRAGERADGLVLNPGAWTHYSWAIRDALEVAGDPRRGGAHLARSTSARSGGACR